MRGECANQCSIIDKLPDASVHYAGIASVDAFMKFMRCTRRRSLIYEPDQRKRETERRREQESGFPLQPVECGICIYLHSNRWINKILGITICCDFILCRAQLNPKGITKYAGTFRELPVTRRGAQRVCRVTQTYARTLTKGPREGLKNKQNHSPSGVIKVYG